MLVMRQYQTVCLVLTATKTILIRSNLYPLHKMSAFTIKCTSVSDKLIRFLQMQTMFLKRRWGVVVCSINDVSICARLCAVPHLGVCGWARCHCGVFWWPLPCHWQDEKHSQSDLAARYPEPRKPLLASDSSLQSLHLPPVKQHNSQSHIQEWTSELKTNKKKQPDWQMLTKVK